MLQLRLAGDFGKEIDAPQVVAAILAAEEPVELHIFSDGGDPYHGFELANAVRDAKQPCSVIVDTFAGSAATFPICATKDAAMSESAMLYLHMPRVRGDGNVLDLEKQGKLLAKIGDVMAQMYAAKSGQTIEVVRRWMEEETYFTAQEALQAGLIDRVIRGVGPKLEARHVAQQVLAKHGQRLGSLLRTFASAQKDTGTQCNAEAPKMNALEKLGLKEGASPEEILAALMRFAATTVDEAEKLAVAKEVLPLLGQHSEPDGDEMASAAKLSAAMDEIEDLRAQLDKSAVTVEAKADADIKAGRWPESRRAELVALHKAGAAEKALFAPGYFKPRAQRLTVGGRPAGAPAIGPAAAGASGDDASARVKQDVTDTLNEATNRARTLRPQG